MELRAGNGASESFPVLKRMDRVAPVGQDQRRHVHCGPGAPDPMRAVVDDALQFWGGFVI